MGRSKLEQLLLVVEKELIKAEKRMNETVMAANEIARSAAHSPSQSGDREHSRNQAYLAQDSYSNLKEFGYKLKKAVLTTAPEKVLPICWLGVSYENGENRQVCFSDLMVLISGITVITASSPLGLALKGKKVGESFKFENGSGFKLGGVITEIE